MILGNIKQQIGVGKTFTVPLEEKIQLTFQAAEINKGKFNIFLSQKGDENNPTSLTISETFFKKYPEIKKNVNAILKIAKPLCQN